MSAPIVPPRPAIRRALPRRALWRGQWWRGGRRLGRRGVTSLEFALAAPVLLMLMGGGIDLGMVLRLQMVMASGLMNTVQYANMQGPSTTSADLRSVMQHGTSLTGMTVNVAGPGLYCPSSYPVTLTPLVNATTCPGASTPANTYVVITASYPYVPLMPGFSHVIATTVVRSATAMLK